MLQCKFSNYITTQYCLISTFLYHYFTDSHDQKIYYNKMLKQQTITSKTSLHAKLFITFACLYNLDRNIKTQWPVVDSGFLLILQHNLTDAVAPRQIHTCTKYYLIITVFQLLVMKGSLLMLRMNSEPVQCFPLVPNSTFISGVRPVLSQRFVFALFVRRNLIMSSLPCEQAK